MPPGGLAFVGVGDLGANAPLHEDGFVTRAELTALQRQARSRNHRLAFDARPADSRLTNDRVASRRSFDGQCLVVAIAKGPAKLPGVKAAVTRLLVNGLITDEWTAEKLLAGN